MAGPTKQDINTIFKRLRSNQANKQCFDCKAMNPTWASVTYGVFLCIDCSAVHRSLGVHLTFIRSTQLDTSWTWLQLRAMQVGGNANANGFFRQHGCTSNDAQQKYNSRAAKLYREKLHHLATQAMREYGTKSFDVKLSTDGSKLHIDSHHHAESPSPDVKEVDFFKEHHDTPLADTTTETTPGMCFSSENAVSAPKPISNGSLAKSRPPPLAPVVDDPGHGPSVDAALSISPTQAQAQAEPRKSTIGARKPASAKKGLGAKKGGLGAQRVRANFSEIESKAQARDQQKVTLEKMAKEHEVKTKEDQDKQMASMRLAYQDMGIERKKKEEKLKQMDPKKAEQFERLGMGFTSQRSASHSIANDMQVIEQETPVDKSRSNFDRYSAKKERDRDFFEDEFEFVGGFSSGPPKYNDSPFGKKEDRFGNGNWGNNSKSSWDTDRFDSKQSSFAEDIPAKERQDDRSGRSRKNYEAAGGNEAQKKFGSAKAISSDAFFSGSSGDFEHKQNMSRFEGSSGISSDDYFGRESSIKKDNYGGNSNAPDLEEIREGVRQGVTKVAGKLSSLANGMITSLQDKYST